ncbi:MAG: hypothetical protein JXQ75_13890 [Phycisphaerae bacterium]|nr:hypothetical protein [Phycisphaerae bacterium]
MMGSAAFFAPLTATVPRNRIPPLITKQSTSVTLRRIDRSDDSYQPSAINDQLPAICRLPWWHGYLDTRVKDEPLFSSRRPIPDRPRPHQPADALRLQL